MQKSRGSFASILKLNRWFWLFEMGYGAVPQMICPGYQVRPFHHQQSRVCDLDMNTLFKPVWSFNLQPGFCTWLSSLKGVSVGVVSFSSCVTLVEFSAENVADSLLTDPSGLGFGVDSAIMCIFSIIWIHIITAIYFTHCNHQILLGANIRPKIPFGLGSHFKMFFDRLFGLVT